jgi:thioester reductase-like protein
MAYQFLTGVTGLVGRYVARELMRAGVPLAVLVRPGKRQTAADRVEGVFRLWEQREGRALIRPVILEGTLHAPGLGLSASQRAWVARHCDTMVHCAAAMVFRPDEAGEPFRTNVQGLAHLLEFCRQAGLRRLHHVSTAYVCGLRQGRVLETELDEGQAMGNVYEESKKQAEQMLHAADWLERLTIYRPASVIGDSQTGFTSQYHGFYLPLQLAYSFATAISPEEMNERFLRRLNLSGEEGKNLVPVDWLAAAIAYLILHPEHHGQTYHLAAPRPVSVRLIQRVVQEAIRRYCGRPIAARANAQELDVYEKLFHDQMLIYRSHWRDDPKFDLTNTGRALPHLPCPEMDFELLMRVARWPVENKFAMARFQQFESEYDARRRLARWLGNGVPQARPANGPALGLQVTGSGGGQWQVWAEGGRVSHADWGSAAEAAASCRLNADTFRCLAEGRLSVEDSLACGRVLLTGPRGARPTAIGILRQLMASC